MVKVGSYVACFRWVTYPRWIENPLRVRRRLRYTRGSSFVNTRPLPPLHSESSCRYPSPPLVGYCREGWGFVPRPFRSGTEDPNGRHGRCSRSCSPLHQPLETLTGHGCILPRQVGDGRDQVGRTVPQDGLLSLFRASRILSRHPASVTSPRLSRSRRTDPVSSPRS